jgi:mannosyltransferase OCH1-like enzyme
MHRYFVALLFILFVVIICFIITLLSYTSIVIVPKIHGNVNNIIHGIPKVIYRTWERNMNRPMYHASYDKWIQLNPDYKMIMYNMDEVEEFMKDYGEKEYLAWKKVIPTAYKADLWRACILYENGGIYVDAYATPNVSLDEMIDITQLKENNIFIASLEEGIHNGFMIVTPKHPFMKQYIKDMVKNINIGIEEKMLSLTGPLCLSKTIKKVTHMKNHCLGYNECKYPYYLFELRPNYHLDPCIVYNDKVLLRKKFDFLYCMVYQKGYKFLIGSNTNYYHAFMNGKVCH